MKRLATMVILVVAVLALTPPALAIAEGRYAIGDSVMLGARDELRARGLCDRVALRGLDQDAVRAQVDDDLAPKHAARGLAPHDRHRLGELS